MSTETPARVAHLAGVLADLAEAREDSGEKAEG